VGEIPMDLDTPLSLFKSLPTSTHNFLLESVEGGEKWGRYSLLGLNPSVVFTSQGKKVCLTEGKKKTVYEAQDPFEELKKVLTKYPYVTLPDLPRFSGGAVGWISYDSVRFFEKIPATSKKKSKVADLCFMIPEILLIADNFQQTLKIVYDARIEKASSIKSVYEKGCQKIQEVVKKLERRVANQKKQKKSSLSLKWISNISEKEHEKMVEKAREYIFAGDITQAVLSLQFRAKVKVDPLFLYRSLRRINPSPYMYLLQMGATSLVGASPETMVHLEKGQMTLRPIAGTRPRGKTDAEDQVLAKELLADQKERAEHIMLVDLGRNDLGRVAKSGTVRVDELMIVEKYSHVMHMVSNVRAALAPGKDAFDVLRATFPAGTLSGSPKIRAMEIIEELESTRRGVYGGCVGYFSFSGNMDMAITIRSALLHEGTLFVQAGSGIVADSKPAMEYQECLNKAKAMMQAVKQCS